MFSTTHKLCETHFTITVGFLNLYLVFFFISNDIQDEITGSFLTAIIQVQLLFNFVLFKEIEIVFVER